MTKLFEKVSRKHSFKDKIRGNAVHVGSRMKSIPEDVIIRIGYWPPGGRIKGGPLLLENPKKNGSRTTGTKIVLMSTRSTLIRSVHADIGI